MSANDVTAGQFVSLPEWLWPNVTTVFKLEDGEMHGDEIQCPSLRDAMISGFSGE